MLSSEMMGAILTPAVSAIISNFVVKTFDKFTDKLKMGHDKYLIPTRQHFEEYLYRSYEKNAIINTLVFRNSTCYIKDIYIPLTIAKEYDSLYYVDEAEYDLDVIEEIQEQVVGYPKDLIKDFPKILISDTAGMGKSTMMKIIFLDIIEQGYGIPILIDLRKLNKENPIIKEIHTQISQLNSEFNIDLLYEFLREGKFIFLLDGYDEIQLSEREYVTSDLENFISRVGNNSFIMTSRPENALASFGDFWFFNVKPLTEEEAYKLLRNYDKSGKISEKLILELQKEEYKNMKEFLSNPLLVSLLFIAFQYKQKIPLKKHLFYRQVYDALFESHDLSKGGSFTRNKRSGLDIDDFEKILRHIAFFNFKKQNNNFTKEELLKNITDAKAYYGELDFLPNDFFKDILNSVPLFYSDGNEYKWAHKSLQEYFAAQFIYRDSKNKQTDILKAIYHSDNLKQYYNLLDIYYDIDYNGFENGILLEFLTAYESYYKNTVLKNISQSRLIKRIELTAFREIRITRSFGVGNYLFNAILLSDTVEMSKAFGNGEEKMVIVEACHREYLINRILFMKGNSLVKKYNEFNYKKTNYKNLEEVIDNLINLYTTITLKKNNKLNSIKFFDELTDFLNVKLKECSTNIQLDYKRCMKKLSILRKKRNERESDYLLEDL